MSGVLSQDLKLLLILVFISVLIVLLDNTGTLNLPKGLLQQVTIPIQYGLYKSGSAVGNQFSFIFLAKKAVDENDALHNQYLQVLSENAQLRKQLSETQGQLTQQSAFDTQTFTMIPARPLGVDRYLIIDKGSDNGLKLNQVVIFKDNYIGEIKQIGPKKSSVLLGTDPESKISAFASNKSGKAKGILQGQFGSEMLLDKVLHDEPMALNDIIYSAGTETDIPRGLILGQISQVISKDGEVFNQAKVKPIVDITDLDVVFVITN